MQGYNQSDNYQYNSQNSGQYYGRRGRNNNRRGGGRRGRYNNRRGGYNDRNRGYNRNYNDRDDNQKYQNNQGGSNYRPPVRKKMPRNMVEVRPVEPASYDLSQAKTVLKMLGDITELDQHLVSNIEESSQIFQARFGGIGSEVVNLVLDCVCNVPCSTGIYAAFLSCLQNQASSITTDHLVEGLCNRVDAALTTGDYTSLKLLSRCLVELAACRCLGKEGVVEYLKAITTLCTSLPNESPISQVLSSVVCDSILWGCVSDGWMEGEEGENLIEIGEEIDTHFKSLNKGGGDLFPSTFYTSCLSDAYEAMVDEANHQEASERDEIPIVSDISREMRNVSLHLIQNTSALNDLFSKISSTTSAAYPLPLLRFEDSSLSFPDSPTLTLPPFSFDEETIQNLPNPTLLHLAPIITPSNKSPLDKAVETIVKDFVIDTISRFSPYSTPKGGTIGSKEMYLNQIGGIGNYLKFQHLSLHQPVEGEDPPSYEDNDEIVHQVFSDICVACAVFPVSYHVETTVFNTSNIISPSTTLVYFGSLLVDYCQHHPSTFPSYLSTSFLTVLNQFYLETTPPLGNFPSLQAIASFLSFQLMNNEFSWPDQQWIFFQQQLKEEEESIGGGDKKGDTTQVGVTRVFLQSVIGNILEAEGCKRLSFVGTIPIDLLLQFLPPSIFSQDSDSKDDDQRDFSYDGDDSSCDAPPQGMLRELCTMMGRGHNSDEEVAEYLMTSVEGVDQMALLVTKVFLFEGKDLSMISRIVERYGGMLKELVDEDQETVINIVIKEIIRSPFSHTKSNMFKSGILSDLIKSGILSIKDVSSFMIQALLSNEKVGGGKKSIKWFDIWFVISTLFSLINQSISSTSNLLSALQKIQSSGNMLEGVGLSVDSDEAGLDDVVQEMISMHLTSIQQEEQEESDQPTDDEQKQLAISASVEYAESLIDHLTTERDAIGEVLRDTLSTVSAQSEDEEESWEQCWILNGMIKFM